MKRVEIIASESVQSDILEAIAAVLPNLEYSLIPSVQGVGRRSRKEGTNVWPEENFVLFSYLEAADAALLRGAVESVKARFPDEGISCFELG